MSSHRSILLDVDGTLVDSNYLHVTAWAQAFAAHGQIVPAWRIHRAIGMGGDKLVSHLIGEHAAAEIGAAASDDHDELFKQLIGQVQPLPGAHDLLLVLKQRKLTVVLASSAGDDEVEHYIDLLGARDLVDAWTTSDDVDRTKPDPDLLHVAMERAGAPAVAMVGDSVWDCRAASNAGLPTLALMSGGISAGELRSAGAYSVHRDAAELAAEMESALPVLASV